MIIRQNILFSLFWLSLLVLFGHVVNLKFSFYYTTWFADVIMHFLGGALIAGLGIFFFTFIFDLKKDDIKSVMILGFLSALSVGALWEVWEVYSGFSVVSIDDFDTIKDLIMDSLGSFFASYVLYKNLKDIK